MKQLEFNIVNNKYLEVLDFTWWIKRIDAIYISHSEMGKKGEYALFIQQGDEVVELYYRTKDELKISAEFKRLSDSLMQVSKGFKNVGISTLLNFNNVTDIKLKKGLFSNLIITKFKDGELIRENASKSLYNEMQNTLKNVQIDNSLAK